MPINGQHGASILCVSCAQRGKPQYGCTAGGRGCQLLTVHGFICHCGDHCICNQLGGCCQHAQRGTTCTPMCSCFQCISRGVRLNVVPSPGAVDDQDQPDPARSTVGGNRPGTDNQDDQPSGPSAADILRERERERSAPRRLPPIWSDDDD